MLRAGFFEDFSGEDTLLIWGDEQGLLRLKELLAGLSGRASRCAAIQEIEGVHVRPNLKIQFELGPSELRADNDGVDVVIVASCSADLLTDFVSKIAELAGPKHRAGHQYLDWPSGASIGVMVSKGEYPDDFGGV